MLRYVIPLLAISALAAPAAAADVQIQAQAPVVELTVSDTVNSKPDTARVSAGVVTRAKSAKEAVSQNAAAMQQVVDKLRALGVPAKDIQTLSFNLNAEYTYPPNGGKPVFAGYQASNQVTVKLHPIDNVGEVLDALVASGANSVSGPSFMLDDSTPVQHEARAQAFQRGLATAQDYARMAGYAGVRLIEASENVQGGGPPPPAPPPIAFRAEAAAQTPIEPGEVGTTVMVTMKFEMTR